MRKDQASYFVLCVALLSIAGWGRAANFSPEPSSFVEFAPQTESAGNTMSFPRQLTLLKEATTSNKENFINRFSVSVKAAELGGVKVRHVTPPFVAREHRDHLFIHLHGGTFVGASGDPDISEAVMIAYRAQIPVLFIDYRLPPKHPFPAAVQDVVNVYLRLLNERPAHSMALGGTSAGGGLALAVTHLLVANGNQLPAVLFAGAPWADLSGARDSHCSNNGIDRSLVPGANTLGAAASSYAGAQNLSDPLISPVNGNFAGFPPSYLVAGTRDLFLSDTAQVHRKLRRAGVIAELNVYAGVSQAEEISVFDSPQSQQVYEELGVFLLKHLE